MVPYGTVARCQLDLCDLGLEVEGFDDVERITGGDLIEKISDAYASYGEDDTVILCRSNKRAIKYNIGVRSTVQFKEERLVRDDKLMIVKNCYQFVEDIKNGTFDEIFKSFNNWHLLNCFFLMMEFVN